MIGWKCQTTNKSQLHFKGEYIYIYINNEKQITAWSDDEYRAFT